MKKIIVLLIVGVLFTVGMLVGKEIILTNDIVNNLDLSNEERSELNYEQLIEDIKALKKGEGLKYAKYVKEDIKESDETGKKISVSVNSSKYQGDGYYAKKELMPDAVGYSFYKKQWNINIFFRQERWTYKY